MNFKTTIVLLVLLAGVGAYFGFTYLGQGKKAETASADTSKLVNLDSADVAKLAITQPDGSRIVLVKSGTQWRLAEPMSAPAESFGADDLVRQITGLQSRGQLAADQKSSLGLDHPSYVVELTGKDGKVHKVSFTSKPKIGDTFDVLVDDRSKPDVVAAASLYEQLDKPASSYRSKKLIDVTSDQMKQVAITNNGKTVRLEKEGSDWKIVEPKAMPGDSSAISTLLFAIQDLNASDFVQSPSAPASYGLAKPAMTVWFSTTAPATQPTTSAPAGTTIAFGRYESIEQKDVYASVNGGPVVTISASTEDSLNKSALDLRDKKIVDIDPAHVTSFTLSVNKAATTQPTTQPSQQYEYTIARRKETPATFGPVLPSAPATQPAATTEPATQPGVATTEPAMQPAIASTQPASKWVFESGAIGNANDTEVEALLGALHPLQATKFIEKAPTTEPAGNYTLILHVGPSNGKGPQDHTLRLTSPGATGNVIGSHEDLVFEADRAILDKLDAKFNATK
jgi:hypothetical protein